jgi:PHP family Zn ribbon phosphoesterase
VLGTVDHLLISGCNYSVYEIADIVHCMGGVCYYAHIDKPSYSVISVLGTIPEDVYFDGVEIHDLSKRQSLIDAGYITEDTPYISDSDAHQLELIGDRECEMDESHPLYSFILE